MPAWTPQTRRVSLRQLCPTARFFAADDIIVESVAADSREVRPGDLFAAVSGTRTDGRPARSRALEPRATAILAERYVPAGELPVCVVPNSSVALARLCQALMDDPMRRLKVIGVTGTNGKTTTTWLIRGILEAAGIRTGLTRHAGIQRRRLGCSLALHNAACAGAGRVAGTYGSDRLHACSDGSF